MTMHRAVLAFAALLFAAAAEAGVIRDRIFQPPGAPLTVDGLPADARIIAVTTADGLALKGVALPPKRGRPVVLLFHGNASSASGALRWLSPLAEAGYGIVAAEYRGYSGNPGTPSEAGLAQDAAAFFAAAKALADGERVLVAGHSLGGGVAFGLARRERLDALITIGTFASIPALAPRIARAFITDRFDNLAAVPALDEPLFIIHGTADDVIPAMNGNQLHNAAIAAKRRGVSFVIDGAGHQPQGATVARLIDVIERILGEGRVPTGAGDPTIKVYAYGYDSAPTSPRRN